MNNRFLYLNVLISFFLICKDANSQKLEWLYPYEKSSYANLITRISDEMYLISGNFYSEDLFTSLFDGQGTLLKTLLFKKRGDDSIVFQSLLSDGNIILLFSNGDIIKIDVNDFTSNIMGNIFENDPTPIKRIQETFLHSDTLSVLTMKYAGPQPTFEFIRFKLSNKIIISTYKDLAYPLKGIKAYYQNRSLAIVRTKDTNSWFEKYDRQYNLQFSLRIDTLFDYVEKVFISNMNTAYLLGRDYKNYNKSTLCAINPDGSFRWCKPFEPVFVDSMFSSFRYFNDIIETPNQQLVLVGSQGYYILGPVSESVILKLDLDGNILWEEKTYLHREGSESNQVVIDSKGDYIATGTLGISDYPVPNRAYIIKYKELGTATKNSYTNLPLEIYPNPSSGHIHFVQNFKTIGNPVIEIFNLQGQKILRKEIQNGNFEYDLKEKKGQIYLIRVFVKEKCIYSTRILIH